MWLAETLGKLVYAVPLLYLGIVLILDPDGMLRLAISVDTALQNFRQALLGGEQWHRHEFKPLSPVMKLVLRFAGAALMAAAIVPLVIVAG